MARFIERPCWAGVDLSMTTDLSAVSFVFPRDDGGYDLLPFFWLPATGVRKRELHDGMPYGQWVEQGFLELSSLLPDVVDYQDVEARLEWGAEMFKLQEICFDPWNSRQISASLVTKGFTCVEIRQGFAMLNEASKKLLELLVAGKLHHGGHPILRWNASCLTSKEYNDNLMFSKPERSRSSSRIDGISATVNALVRAIVSMPQTSSAIEVW
jgi:phage terminase large subunit-like protein